MSDLSDKIGTDGSGDDEKKDEEVEEEEEDFRVAMQKHIESLMPVYYII